MQKKTREISLPHLFPLEDSDTTVVVKRGNALQPYVEIDRHTGTEFGARMFGFMWSQAEYTYWSIEAPC